MLFVSTQRQSPFPTINNISRKFYRIIFKLRQQKIVNLNIACRAATADPLKTFSGYWIQFDGPKDARDVS